MEVFILRSVPHFLSIRERQDEIPQVKVAKTIQDALVGQLQWAFSSASSNFLHDDLVEVNKRHEGNVNQDNDKHWPKVSISTSVGQKDEGHKSGRDLKYVRCEK